jgi:sarcosine oxidase subunit gamma
MSEPVSALKGASFEGIVTVRDFGPRGMVTVRGDLSSAKLRDAVTGAAGVGFPAKAGAVVDGERGLAWMSPDELLVLLPHGDAAGAVGAMQAALAGEHALVADVSDARAAFRVEGDGRMIREVLAKLTPADMRTRSLPVGEMRRTRLAQVPAAVFFHAEGVAEVICFRSVAVYVFGLLQNAATPGSEVGYFG